MRERSVTRAGEQLGLSQPAVSAALNRLRHLFNDALFVRQGNEMAPTPRAIELAGRARSALSEIEYMIRSVRELDLQALDRTFTLMGSDFFSLLLMPSLSHRVSSTAPKVKLRLLDSARGDVSRLLLENSIDMALERPLNTPEWVSSTILFRSPFVIIASKNNVQVQDIPDGAEFPLNLFIRLPHALRSVDGSMSGMVDAALSERGYARSVKLTLPHFQAIALAVATGDYIAAVPEQFSRRVKIELGLRTFAPPISIPTPEVNLYWHARNDEDAAHQWIRAEVKETVQKLCF